MARKRDGFVPIGDVVAGGELPGGFVLTHHAATPQARPHFTQLDQVTQLVGASEADADLGFMARMLALCSLPRTNPGDKLQYVRRNGPFTLYMTVSGSAKLPYGNSARLLLAWVCTEAVRTQNRELILGDSLSAFMRTWVSTTLVDRCVVGSKTRCGGSSTYMFSWAMSASTVQ